MKMGTSVVTPFLFMPALLSFGLQRNPYTMSTDPKVEFRSGCAETFKTMNRCRE